ncbi:alpha/beta hydrolase [Flavobacteriaceae bacterium R38]|nr:alpha/beta hydrolase [Flavobacteriaceae bacterium R38]
MMHKIFPFVLILAIFLSCESRQPSEIENVQNNTETNALTVGFNHIFKSEILNENRPIIISLPEGYSDSDASYPVLYLTDGLQNIWHTIGTVEVLTRTGNIPPIIVVGIESVNRIRDFTITASENNSESGGGKKFLRFIEEELVPYINTNYRTNSFKALEGHSLGGLFTTATLIEKPDLFDAYIIMSPSYWWNDQEIISKGKEFFLANPTIEKALFFGVGTYESGMREFLKSFIDMIEEMKPSKLRYEHREMEKEGHMSSPLLSNYYGLKFIFSDMKFSKELYANFDDKDFIDHEERVMTKYGESAKQSGENYVNLAFLLIEKENFSGAITVLKRSIEAYPFDVNLVNLLANVYERNKDIQSAVKTYEKAIEISKEYNYNREEEFQEQIDRLTTGN